MYQVYTIKNHSELTKTQIGEYKDYDEAMDIAEDAIKKNSELNFIVEETDGHFNSYGDLVTTVVAQG